MGKPEACTLKPHRRGTEQLQISYEMLALLHYNLPQDCFQPLAFLLRHAAKCVHFEQFLTLDKYGLDHVAEQLDFARNLIRNTKNYGFVKIRNPGTLHGHFHRLSELVYGVTAVLIKC